MPVEGQLRQLFEEIKYKRKFPPRDTAASIKSQLAVRGLGNSGVLIEQVTQAYLQVVEDVLDEFADAVITRVGALGLSTEAELGGVIADAHQHLFNLAVGALFQEFKGNPEYGNRAMTRLEERRGPAWDHLQRAITLNQNLYCPLRSGTTPIGAGSVGSKILATRFLNWRLIDISTAK